MAILIPNIRGRFLGWTPWNFVGERATRKQVAIQGGAAVSGGKATGWRAEVFFPYDLLKPLANVPPQPGTKWRANFYRMDYDGDARTQWAWSPVEKNFHQYEKFGSLIFD